ncbi:MAG TPA: helix-turn-helix domain-containing protein [Xanthobacteraceae bacterium]|nr:helix-turn-helix domain-containing protein [Xanthobacteraceae bacterium]
MPRGRPRTYDPEIALQRATESFWRAGYAATSLDDLSAATGMNRPSLYGAFGDKRGLYLAALRRYWELSHVAMEEALASDRTLREVLRRLYRKALAGYFGGKDGPRGCFAIGMATTEAVRDRKIRALLAVGIPEDR